MCVCVCVYVEDGDIVVPNIHFNCLKKIQTVDKKICCGVLISHTKFVLDIAISNFRPEHNSTELKEQYRIKVSHLYSSS